MWIVSDNGVCRVDLLWFLLAYAWFRLILTVIYRRSFCFDWLPASWYPHSDMSLFSHGYWPTVISSYQINRGQQLLLTALKTSLSTWRLNRRSPSLSSGMSSRSEHLKSIFHDHFRRQRVCTCIMTVRKDWRFTLRLIWPSRPEHRPKGEVFKHGLRWNPTAKGIDFSGAHVIPFIVKLPDVSRQANG